jgi:UDP-N-acetylmuramate--alanine ligase
LAAIAVADELEVPLDVVKDALATFHGVARRFSIVAEAEGVTLVDDYGHHPAEIEATLAAARNAYSQRIVVAFQPHRYTRTQSLFEDFTRAFNQADVLFVTDIYAGGEAPIPGISGETLAEGIALHGQNAVRYVADKALLAGELSRVARSGDVVIALGAGDINKILPMVANEISARVREREGAT